MAEAVFVTGGTGLTGANVCEQLIERGEPCGRSSGVPPMPRR